MHLYAIFWKLLRTIAYSHNNSTFCMYTAPTHTMAFHTVHLHLELGGERFGRTNHSSIFVKNEKTGETVKYHAVYFRGERKLPLHAEWEMMVFETEAQVQKVGHDAHTWHRKVGGKLFQIGVFTEGQRPFVDRLLKPDGSHGQYYAHWSKGCHEYTLAVIERLHACRELRRSVNRKDVHQGRAAVRRELSRKY